MRSTLIRCYFLQEIMAEGKKAMVSYATAPNAGWLIGRMAYCAIHCNSVHGQLRSSPLRPSETGCGCNMGRSWAARGPGRPTGPGRDSLEEAAVPLEAVRKKTALCCAPIKKGFPAKSVGCIIKKAAAEMQYRRPETGTRQEGCCMYRVETMDLAQAQAIAAWRYPAPYDVYNFPARETMEATKWAITIPEKRAEEFRVVKEDTRVVGY